MEITPRELESVILKKVGPICPRSCCSEKDIVNKNEGQNEDMYSKLDMTILKYLLNDEHHKYDFIDTLK
jgi:hypothetical protein